MPALRGVYSVTPTALSGKYIDPSGGNTTYIGVTQASIDAIVPVSPNAVNTVTFKNTLQTNIQSAIDASHPQGAGAVTVTVIIKVINPLKWGVIFS